MCFVVERLLISIECLRVEVKDEGSKEGGLVLRLGLGVWMFCGIGWVSELVDIMEDVKDRIMKIVYI